MKNTLISVLIIVVIVLGGYALLNNKATAPTNTGNPTSQETQLTAATHCGLTIDAPLAGATVTFPLTIQATVDNTQSTALGCSWGVFEAQAGTVEIKDTNGASLATGILTTTSDWMTANATPYSVTISALSNPGYTGALSLIFNEENPGDLPSPDSLTVAVLK